MWYDNVDTINKPFLLSLYNKVPKLDDIELLKTVITYNKVSLIFRMPYYADNPPTKWVIKKCNSVLIELDICVVKNISFSRKGNGTKVNMKIIKRNDELEIELNGDTNIKIVAEACMIQKIEGMITNKALHN